MNPANVVDLGEAQARRLENVSEQLTLLLSQPSVAQRLRSAASEAEWSALEVFGHLIEMVPYWLDQCRVLSTTTEPSMFGRGLDAPERLAGPELGVTTDIEALLELWHANVKTAAQTIREMTTVERSKKGQHVRRGEMTVSDIVELFVVTHAEEHLTQIRTTLQS